MTIFKATVAEMKAIKNPSYAGNLFFCKATRSLYYWDSESEGTNDDELIIQPTGLSTGRFIAIRADVFPE